MTLDEAIKYCSEQKTNFLFNKQTQQIFSEITDFLKELKLYREVNEKDNLMYYDPTNIKYAIPKELCAKEACISCEEYCSFVNHNCEECQIQKCFNKLVEFESVNNAANSATGLAIGNQINAHFMAGYRDGFMAKFTQRN